MTINVSYLVDTASAGDEYETFAAWKAARQAIRTDLVSAGDIEKLVIKKLGNHQELVDISGWTTDADNYVWITVDPAYRHDTVQQSGFYMYLSSEDNATPVFDCTQDYTLIEYLDVRNDWDGTGLSHAISVTCDGAVIHGCLGEALTGCAINAASLSANSDLWPKVINCLALGGVYGICRYANSRQKIKIYNCGVTGCTNGYYGLASTEPALVINSWARDCSDQWAGTYWDSNCSNNGSTDGTAPGTSSVTFSDSDLEDPDNGDYRLSGEGSVLFDAGTNLSTIFTEDAEGETWIDWSIGFDQYNLTPPVTVDIDVTEPQDVLSAAVTIVDAYTYDLDVTEPQDVLSGAIQVGGDVPIPTLANPRWENISYQSFTGIVDVLYLAEGGTIIATSTALNTGDWVESNGAEITSAVDFTLAAFNNSAITSTTAARFPITNGKTYKLQFTLSSPDAVDVEIQFTNSNTGVIFATDFVELSQTPTMFEIEALVQNDATGYGKARIRSGDGAVIGSKDIVFELLEVIEA